MLGLALLTAGAVAASAAEAPPVRVAAEHVAAAKAATTISCHVLPVRGVDPAVAQGRCARAAPPSPAKPAATIPAGAGVNALTLDQLQYNGGPVLTTAQLTVLTLNSAASAYGNPAQFMSDLFASPFIRVADQYVVSNAANRYSVNPTSVPVVAAENQVMLDVDVQAAVIAAVKAANPQGGGGGLNNIYALFMPQGQDLCDDNTRAVCYSPDNSASFYYCAYHSAFSAPDAKGNLITVVYEAIPYQNVALCGVTGPNGAVADSTNTTFSHETFEAITDPYGSAWYISNASSPDYGNEMADNCTLEQVQTLNGHAYSLQTEWSNNAHECVGQFPRPATRGLRDFNGDGTSDILWTDTSGNIVVWTMNGGSPAGATAVGAIPTSWSVAGVGDFNGDGTSDILWRNTNGDLAIWFMTGGKVVSAGLIGNLPANWGVIGVGDFNGDGYADILLRNSATGDLGLWQLNGTTVVGAGLIGNLPSGWSVVGVGDVNGDGYADILLRNANGDVGLWTMNGAIITGATLIGNVPNAWSIASIADFNGDGKADVLWRNSNGAVAVWLMNGPAVLSAPIVGSAPASWTILGTADFNADWNADILWRNSNSDHAIWTMNGASVIGATDLGVIPNVWTALGN
jgi:hypothetical protein